VARPRRRSDAQQDSVSKAGVIAAVVGDGWVCTVTIHDGNDTHRRPAREVEDEGPGVPQAGERTVRRVGTGHPTGTPRG